MIVFTLGSSELVYAYRWLEFGRKEIAHVVVGALIVLVVL